MLTIPNVANIFTNLTLQEAFETAAEIGEEIKKLITEFYGAFCKN